MAGKSSIIDMITTCLFFQARGTDARGAGMDNLIHTGEKEFSIEFSFKLEDNIYKVIRTKKFEGAQTLDFFINEVDHSEKINVTQQKILNTIKLNYNTFLDTICIGQNESGRFMKKKPNERKEVFKQILKLDDYDILESYTKDLRKDIKLKLDNSESKTNMLMDIINNKQNYIDNKTELEISLKESKENISVTEKELEKEVQRKIQYEQLQKQNNILINRKNKVDSDLISITNNINKGLEFKQKLIELINSSNNIDIEIQILDKELSDQIDEHNTLTGEKSSISTLIQTYESDLIKIKDKYKNLKQYNKLQCNFCGQNITEEYKEQFLTELKTEGIEKTNQINQSKDKLNNINIKINELISNVSIQKQKLNGLRDTKTKVDQAKIKLENAEVKLIELEKQKIELIKEKEELDKNTIVKLEVEYFNDDVLKSKLNQLRSNLNSITSNLAIIENKLQNIEVQEKELEKIQLEQQSLTEENNIYKELITAWSKNGIQALIIDNILPQIEEKINFYLDKLSSGKIKINFITQKNNKKGDAMETLEIMVTDPLGIRTYECYSGGEKMRVDLACHIGLAQFLAQRAGCKIDFFIIDEGIGCLDAEGRDTFIEMLNIMSSIFNKIFVISHIAEIKELFSSKILIYKTINNGSEVKIINE